MMSNNEISNNKNKVDSNIFGIVFIIVSFILLFSLFIFIGLAPLRKLSHQTYLEKKTSEIKHIIEQNTFSDVSQVLETLQNNLEIKTALLNPNQSNKALIVCRMAKEIINASIVYLMDTNGVVISSTKYLTDNGQTSSLLGNNYTFRPYFTNALEGKTLIYPAVGITTGKRGIYCSAPVYDQNNAKIIGVIVIKLDVEQIDSNFRSYNQKILLLSPEHVVFATNVNKLLYGVPELEYQQIINNIKETRQYDENKIIPLPFDINATKIILNDTTYLVRQQSIAKSNWLIVVYEAQNPNFQINKNLIKIVVVITIVFILLSLIIIRLLYIIKRRDKAESELKQNRESLRTTLDSIGDGVISVNSSGEIIQINLIALHLLNTNSESAIGKHISEVFTAINPTTKHPDKEIIEAINNGKGNISKELIIKNQLKKDYEISVLVNPLVDNENNLLGMVMVIRDITQEKETKLKLKKQNKQIKEALKKAEESDELKTAFLQNISHEVRTPLNGIVGFSELLSATELNQKTIDEYNQHIISNANYLLDIIQNVIEISKIETNQISINNIRFDLNKICQDIFKRYKSIHANDNEIELILSVKDPEEPLYLKNDLEKTIKVFNILLDNAFKFTTSGKVIFGYKIKKNKVECFVEDTGIGISEEFHSNIFKHFIKLSENNKNLPRGVGIGLSIAQRYIILLGGSIWLESEKDKGSIFYFTLPFKD